MKNWLNRYPVFVKRLWFRLAISYTLLAFCAITLLIAMIFGINDYKDFQATLTLDNVEKQVTGEKLIVAQAIHNADSIEWRSKARDSIREKLINLEHGKGTTVYRIANSSLPEVYIQIVDGNDRILLSDPADFPEKIAAQFAAQKRLPAAESSVTWLAKSGPIWVDTPVTDAHDGFIGRLRVLYVAEFNIWVQLRSILDFLLNAWGPVVFCSVPIGIACGLVASRYVTRQLRKMNEVTESWRQGNFDARIALPNDDVLIRHSQHLNDMAQDMELLLSLKQNVALSNERNRMARELHDTVKQKLFALGLQLATARSKPGVMEAASENVLEAETITREAQHDLMEIITQLRHTGTGDTSLYERIGTIADGFKRRFNVSVELDCCDPVRCNAHTEHNVLRIVQEALMNAVRHGRASRIVIACGIGHDAVTLTIADNGGGFDAARKTQGFGITSMQDRARDLPDGKFEILSAAQEGTRIILSWKNES